MTDKNHQQLGENRFTSRRRNFLRKVGSTAALTTFGTTGVSTARHADSGPFNNDPFSLGIASGDPLPTAVVIWTRLAPKPLEKDGGMPNHPFPVQWRVATDENMHNVVKRGTKLARPELAHSVHVDVQGLEHDTEYYYRFKAGSIRSSVGRTKTAPAAGADIDEFSFAFASCQNYNIGYYTAYEHMAEEDLDLVVFLGDYIYEGPRQGSIGRGHQPPRTCQTLSDYRIRYAQYKTDPNLQAAHAAFPWIVTWDDHEVANNWTDEDHPSAPPEIFLQRRANAFKAYWEHQPLRRSRMPDGPDMPLYRRFSFGDLAEFNVLDTRQYRDNQACGGGIVAGCEEHFDLSRTILGQEQEDWLISNLSSSDVTWDVLAQQIFFSHRGFADEDLFNMNFWDGYIADRNRVIETMQENVTNPIVLTGDVHRNWQANIKADFQNPDSETVGAEFIGTSISSGGNGSDSTEAGRWGVAVNPHIHYFNKQRGYVRCELTPEQWRTDYRVVPYVTSPGAPIRTDATFIVEAGTPSAQRK